MDTLTSQHGHGSRGSRFPGFFHHPKWQSAAIRLCIQENTIRTGDFVADYDLVTERLDEGNPVEVPEMSQFDKLHSGLLKDTLRRLPTCHYERQKATSTGLQLKPMELKDD